MLLFCIFFWFNFSNCSDSLPSKSMQKIVVIQPDGQSDEEFCRDMNEIIADVERETGGKVSDVKFLKNRTMEITVPLFAVQEVRPVPGGASPAESASSGNRNLGLDSFFNDEIKKLVLQIEPEKTFRRPQEVFWVKEFYDQYKESLSKKCPQIADEYISPILQLLSRSVIPVTDEQSDILSEKIQLLKIFQSFYQDIWVGVEEALLKKRTECVESGKIRSNLKISKAMYFDVVVNALSESTLTLEHNQHGIIGISLDDINLLGHKIIDNITKKLEQEDNLITTRMEKKVVEKLSKCRISESEFLTLSLGEQHMFLFISSILLDSSMGKQYSAEPWKDYKRLFSRLLKLLEPLRQCMAVSKKGLDKAKDLGSIEETFNQSRDIVFRQFIEVLNNPSFDDQTCVIDGHKIIWNEPLLNGLVSQFLSEVALGAESSSSSKHEVSLDLIQKAQMQAERVKAIQIAKEKDKQEMLLARRQQQEEAIKAREAFEAQQKAQAEKKEAARQRKEQQRLEAERIALEQKAQKERDLALRRQKELERQKKLNELRKKEEEEQEKSRLLRIQLDDERVRKLSEIVKLSEEILKDHQAALKQQEALFIRTYCSAILSSKGIIHNPYAQKPKQ